MAKQKKGGYYAVQVGYAPGVYESWGDCEAQVKGFPNAKHQKFTTRKEAEDFAQGPSLPRIDRPTSTRKDKAASMQSDKPSDKKRGVDAVDAEDAPATKKQKVSTEHRDGDWVVFSDGACKGNGNQGSYAGVGVWWGHGDERNIAERCPGDQTNNRAELIAIARVLEETPVDENHRLVIMTDSKYSINCFDSWIHKWRRNGWQSGSGPVKNAPVIRYIAARLEGRIALGQKVKLEYVKGHAGIEGNEGADSMANFGASLSEIKDELDWDSMAEAYREEFQSILDKRNAQPYGGANLEVEAPPEVIEETKNVEEAQTEPPAAPLAVAQSELDADDLAQYAEGWADDDELSDDLD